MKTFAKNLVAAAVLMLPSAGCADPHRDLVMSSEGVTELFTPPLRGQQHLCAAINATTETRQIFMEIFTVEHPTGGAVSGSVYSVSVIVEPRAVKTVYSGPSYSDNLPVAWRYCKISVDGPASMVRGSMTATRVEYGSR